MYSYYTKLLVYCVKFNRAAMACYFALIISMVLNMTLQFYLRCIINRKTNVLELLFAGYAEVTDAFHSHGFVVPVASTIYGCIVGVVHLTQLTLDRLLSQDSHKKPIHL